MLRIHIVEVPLPSVPTKAYPQYHPFPLTAVETYRTYRRYTGGRYHTEFEQNNQHIATNRRGDNSFRDGRNELSPLLCIFPSLRYNSNELSQRCERIGPQRIHCGVSDRAYVYALHLEGAYGN
jgi:hypothetical protein